MQQKYPLNLLVIDRLQKPSSWKCLNSNSPVKCKPISTQQLYNSTCDGHAHSNCGPASHVLSLTAATTKSFMAKAPKPFQLQLASPTDKLCDSWCECTRWKSFLLGRLTTALVTTGTSLGIATSHENYRARIRRQEPSRRYMLWNNLLIAKQIIPFPTSLRDELKLLGMKFYTFSEYFASIK